MARPDDPLNLLVARLYDTAFDRYSDAGGAAYWAGVLASGASLRSVSDRFFASPEFTARHAGLDDDAYLRLLYRDALEREPDPVGLASWLRNLAGGMSRSEVFFRFLESDEQKSGFARSEIRGVEGFDPDDGASPTDRLIARLYDTAFDRYPDAGGAAYWAGVLAAGASLRSISEGFFASAEFTARHAGLDDGAYVRMLYRDALEREPEAAGLAYWVGRLGSGASRSDVFFGFFDSEEQKRGFSHSIAQGVTGAPPPPPGNPVDAVDDAYAVAEDSSTFFSGANRLLANDIAPDGGLSVVVGPAGSTFTTISTENGQAIVNADGSFSYSPNAGFIGVDRFTYRARDADGSTDDATVTIRVGIGGGAPADAVDDAYTVLHDSTIRVPAASGVLANDSAPDGGLRVVGFVLGGGTLTTLATGNGIAQISPDGSFTYAPAPGFTGTDRLTYRIRDTDGSTDDATIDITVSPGRPVDAVDDAYAVLDGGRLTVPGSPGVLANDSAPDGGLRVLGLVLGGDTLSTLATGNGIAQIGPDGALTYEPAPGFRGIERLAYRVEDADGSTDDATITINVGIGGGAPVDAVDDAYAVLPGSTTRFPAEAGLLANDSGADGGLVALGFVLGGGTLTTLATGNGIAQLSPDGAFTYAPAPGFTGVERLTYRIRDVDGSTDDATVTITVGSGGAFDAVDDAYTTGAGTLLEVSGLGPGGLLSNDSAPGNLIAVQAGDVVTAQGVRVRLSANGSFSYTPALGYSGLDSFTYTATGPGGLQDTALVTITVLPDGFAQDDAYTTQVNSPLSVFVPGGGRGLLANDVSGGYLVAVVAGAVASSSGGQAMLYLDGTFTYTPPSGFVGTDSFTYVATRSDGSADVATVTVAVTAPLPGNPVDAVDDSYRTPQDTPLSVGAAAGLLVNDSAPDGGAQAGSGSFATAQGGTVALQASGAFLYTPRAGFTGVDSFDYRLQDVDGSTDTATARITVSAPSPVPPVRLSDVASGIGGLRIRGAAPFDKAGSSVAGVGDLDGDGRGDLLIGAPYAQFERGAAYLLFSGAGVTDLSVFDQPAGTAGGFRIVAEGDVNRAGTSVAGAGDVNGDGRPDLLVGAPLNDANTATPFFDGAGAAYVVFGKATAGDVDLAGVAGGSGGFKIVGEAAGDQAGYSVAGAGDVNGDGLADVAVGARLHAVGGSELVGTTYVVFGKGGTAAVDLSAVAAGAGGFAIDGEGAGGQAGSAVSSAGDMNGDGLADLLIATGGTDSATGGRSAYVVFGKGDTAAVRLADVAAGSGGFKITRAGEPPLAIAAAGDVNGDGRPDLVIGEQSASPGSVLGAGVATVVFGKADTATVDISPGTVFAGYRIVGTDVFGGLGAAVSAAGDLNGDGLGDLLVGAPGSGVNAAYAVFGKRDGADVNLADIAAGRGGFKIVAEGNDDALGISVASAGDANGDGLADLLVGSWANIDFQTQVGATYLIYGSRG